MRVSPKGTQAIGYGRVGFRHELVRLAVLSVNTPSQLKNLNARILALVRGNPELLRSHIDLAAHCAVAAGDGDAILELAPLAARGAAQLGVHKEAASHLASALRVASGAADELAAQLHEDWAYET